MRVIELPMSIAPSLVWHDDLFFTSFQRGQHGLHGHFIRINLSSMAVTLESSDEYLVFLDHTPFGPGYFSAELQGDSFLVRLKMVDRCGESTVCHFTVNRYLEESPLCLSMRLRYFFLGDKYLLYLVDEPYMPDFPEYNHLDSRNNFRMFLHVISEDRSYEVLDRELSRNGMRRARMISVNGREVLLLVAAEMNMHDKQENWNAIAASDVGYLAQQPFLRLDESLRLFDFKEFVNAVKCGSNSIAPVYSDNKGNDGSIWHIGNNDTSFFYEISNFDGTPNVIRHLDAIDLTVNERVLDRPYEDVILAHGKVYLLYSEADIIRLRDIFEPRRQFTYPTSCGEFLTFLDERRIILNQYGDMPGASRCIVFDLEAYTVVAEYNGIANYYEDSQVICIWGKTQSEHGS